MGVQYSERPGSASGIAALLERAVERGELAPGSALPSIRVLARRFDVSPGTAASAVKDLQRRGIVVSESRRGTRVNARPPLSPPATLPLPHGIRDLASGNPDPALLPPLAWALEDGPPSTLLYGEDATFAPLVDWSREDLQATGVEGEHLVVTSGAMDGLERLLAAWLRPGDRVALEDPAYANAIDLLRAMGLVPVPMAVDDEGPLPDELASVLDGIAAVVVTPRAQNPLGAALSATRAGELRHVLERRPEVGLVENDHSGALAGAAYHSLHGRRERWAVIRSFSKMLSPDLRLAVVAGDATTVSQVRGRQLLGTGWVSHLLQHIAHRLLIDGRTQRLVSEAAEIYTQRRSALLDALREREIPAHGASGLNVLIPAPREALAVQALFARGWAVKPGEGYRMRTGGFVRATTAALADDEVDRLADDIAEALRPARRITSA